MRQLRPILAMLAVAAILVACSGAPGNSSGNQQSQGAEASDGGSGGGASDGGGGSGASDGGGGGGGGIFGDGSADYQVTGGITAEGDLGFVPAASQMNQNGVYNLSFSNENSDVVLIIILSNDGDTLSWTNSEASIAGAQCDFNVTRKDDNGAEGTFTCNNQPFFSGTGASGTANISGSFDARI